MVYIHTPMMTGAAVRQTHRSRELEERIGQAIRDYRHVNPDVSDEEVRAALSLATSHHGGARSNVPRRLAAIMAGVVAVGVGVSASLGDRLGAGGGGSVALTIAVGAIAVAAVLVGLVLASRR